MSSEPPSEGLGHHWGHVDVCNDRQECWTLTSHCNFGLGAMYSDL
jgi:hypothetical protein